MLCEIFPQDTLCITGTQVILVVLYSTKDTVGLIVQYKTSCLVHNCTSVTFDYQESSSLGRMDDCQLARPSHRVVKGGIEF